MKRSPLWLHLMHKIRPMSAYGSNEPKITHITLTTHNLSHYALSSMHIRALVHKKEQSVLHHIR